jgi:hypothetical protein
MHTVMWASWAGQGQNLGTSSKVVEFICEYFMKANKIQEVSQPGHYESVYDC